jgi:hypothetical protein
MFGKIVLAQNCVGIIAKDMEKVSTSKNSSSPLSDIDLFCTTFDNITYFLSNFQIRCYEIKN